MTPDHDLAWLAAQRPATAAPAAQATAHARAALLAHVSAPRLAALPARPAAARPRVTERRWLRPSRILALAGVAAAGAVAFAVLTDAGWGGATGGVPIVGVEQASALERVAGTVAALPAPDGDATLVARTHAEPDGSTEQGFDLYTDDGYLYSESTRARLAAAVRADEPSELDGAIQREIDAARAASAPGADLAAARALLLAAPGVDDAPAASAAAARSRDDSRVWSGALEALVAGFGRTDVRAGVLALLGTIETVEVREGTAADGRATLELDYAPAFDDGGGALEGRHEVLSVDAATGAPIHFVGGAEGSPPDVDIAFDVSRVTRDELAA